ncbi:hypothetical protein [Tatumella morbirosei]|uniref:hypothetical protein n=1 Tax=Tatumella morbirosei TaxID=642227 RepID=UPI0012ED001A|nr:hypothetical protein [Tatumella morbirosei]
MTTKSALSRLRAQLAHQHNDDSRTDVSVISALMDEIAGDKPDGTAAAIEARQHRRTGYTFPHSPELRSALNMPSDDLPAC